MRAEIRQYVVACATCTTFSDRQQAELQIVMVVNCKYVVNCSSIASTTATTHNIFS